MPFVPDATDFVSHHNSESFQRWQSCILLRLLFHSHLLPALTPPTTTTQPTYLHYTHQFTRSRLETGENIRSRTRSLRKVESLWLEGRQSLPEWREMTEQIDWRAKRPSQVACFSEVLRSLGHYLQAQSSTRWSSLKGPERAVVNQMNIGTVSKATLGKLLRDGVGFSECIDAILN